MLGSPGSITQRLTDRCNFLDCSEVRFEAVHLRSNVFQAQVVIHRVSQFLFASQVMLGRLNRCMAEQELNLFKFSPSQMTESCAGAA